MWCLIEDFFDQPLVMKGLVGWGWLCIVLMIASLVASLLGG
ncbi:MAG: hypothetical protein QF921_10115 [Pseudomonadales bacterium]|jgi:uncharacterized membrane protein|nr:hypothetical protein [Pseudomonadales bacterium]MDP6473107.1 hypothetical protein [Pseudomonadales bacterium]MDP6826136.1 hypothetical protein [Pseudomonadales bacterium]MDP6971849.1 hypothetical protein [Pseudomonadales bacterium]|tara:strand:- start:1619 stop:1741 length:123 start_codon:yes stop_codon:yes gene_type:complete